MIIDNEIFQTLFKSGEVIEPIRCMNGLIISVQCTSSHRANRREVYVNSEWATCECGFPNRELQELKEYAEVQEHLLDTVYNYVPVDLVIKILNDNGGIAPEYIL